MATDWKDALSALTGVTPQGNDVDNTPQHNVTRKKREGIVYSTNNDFAYTEEIIEEAETLPNKHQKLRIRMERAGRGGKTVTIVSGFIGTTADLQTLCKLLKQKCGVGGTAKDNEIIMQGDLRPKLKDLLIKKGYTQTK